MSYLQFTTPFDITGREFIDRRMMLTKAEMLSLTYADGTSFKKRLPLATSTPAYLAAFCTDDLSWYFYHANNSENSTTGKFVKMASGSDSTKATVGTTSEMSAALATANAGDKFINTEDGKTYTAQFNDEGTLCWVEDSPAVGAIVYDIVNNKLKYYDGTEWKEIGSGSSGLVIPVTELPSSPIEGAIYALDDGTGAGNQYKIYIDGWDTLSLTWEGTQAAYDAITVKNPSTIYFIRSA